MNAGDYITCPSCGERLYEVVVEVLGTDSPTRFPEMIRPIPPQQALTGATLLGREPRCHRCGAKWNENSGSFWRRYFNVHTNRGWWPHPKE